MFSPKVLLAVALGGACGAVLRYLTTAAVTNRAIASIWATFGVNSLGSLLIGALAATAANGNLSPVAKAAVISGFLGSLTTFSTFSLETFLLVRDDRLPTAVAYAVFSLLVGLVGATIGWQLVHRA